jgi:myosin heavy subunit
VHRKDERDNFQVLHFAGVVKYTVHGWVLKNSDPLPEAMPATFFDAPKALSITKAIFPQGMIRSSSGVSLKV